MEAEPAKNGNHRPVVAQRVSGYPIAKPRPGQEYLQADRSRLAARPPCRPAAAVSSSCSRNHVTPSLRPPNALKENGADGSGGGGAGTGGSARCLCVHSPNVEHTVSRCGDPAWPGSVLKLRPSRRYLRSAELAPWTSGQIWSPFWSSVVLALTGWALNEVGRPDTARPLISSSTGPYGSYWGSGRSGLDGSLPYLMTISRPPWRR